MLHNLSAHSMSTAEWRMHISTLRKFQEQYERPRKPDAPLDEEQLNEFLGTLAELQLTPVGRDLHAELLAAAALVLRLAAECEVSYG